MPALSSSEWGVRQLYAVHGLPVFGRNHFDCIPGTAVEKRAIRSLADAFLAADAEIRINFNAAKRFMVRVRNPEHAGFDGTVFDTGR